MIQTALGLQVINGIMRETTLNFTQFTRFGLVGILGALLFLSMGCQSSPEMAAAPALPSATLLADQPPATVATMPPTLPAPRMVVDGEQNRDGVRNSVPPSFSPLSDEDVAATATAQVPTATLFPTATPFDSAEVVEGPTATPPPTFTPPPAPAAANRDHYWLRRPVPDGTAVWTDKAYPFGSTRNGTLRPHHGVEFNVTYDTPVLAAASGEVVYAGADDGQLIGPEPNFYGNVIVVKIDGLVDGREVFILYGHLNAVEVAMGQRVNAGDRLGLSGATGVADGPHLHFEVRVGTNSYADSRNPLLWLYPFTGHGTVAGRVTWPDGSPVLEAPVTLRRVDGSSRYTASTTYADPALKPDPAWGENFALDDVEAGYYELTVGTGDNRQKVELWVYEAQTTFVEVVLQLP